MARSLLSAAAAPVQSGRVGAGNPPARTPGPAVSLPLLRRLSWRCPDYSVLSSACPYSQRRADEYHGQWGRALIGDLAQG